MMAKNEFKQAAVEDEARLLDHKLRAEKLAHSGTKQALKDTASELARLEREFGFVTATQKRVEPPKWVSAPRMGKTKKYVTPNVMISDLHLDEVVDPDQVMGMNSYNRHIALLRLNHTIESIVSMCFDYKQGFTYPGIVVNMGGDIFSGDIHDELSQTNEGTLMDGFVYWLTPMAEAFQQLADEFGKVQVNVVVGNHGRTSRKPRMKDRVRSNYDWLFGVMLDQILASDKRITFTISESADMTYDTYGYRTMLTHGDQARGGSGWGGIASPIMRLQDKKQKRQTAVRMPFDYMVMGHWHQLIWFPQVVINGSMKGYDEYAFTENFGFEPPQQALWFMTPQHGRTDCVPIFCEHPDEDWRGD
jgi:hypothetical protein